MSLKPDTVKAIFTNLLFVIGVVLIIFGFGRGALTIANMLVFDKYPLQSYEETRCELEYNSVLARPVIEGEKVTPLTKEESDVRRAKCNESVEHDRSVRKVNDIVTSVTTLLAGVVVAYMFKRFIFK